MVDTASSDTWVAGTDVRCIVSLSLSLSGCFFSSLSWIKTYRLLVVCFCLISWIGTHRLLVAYFCRP